jgi:hypothetical protein
MSTNFSWPESRTPMPHSSDKKPKQPYLGFTPCPPLTGHIGGKDPITQKKIKKGDATMATVREVLGVIVNGVGQTVQLAKKKAGAIIKELARLIKWKIIPLKRVEKIVGKLIHACTILPTSKSLLTPIYRSMASQPSMVGLGKESEVWAEMLNLKTMIKSIAARPTHVFELIPRTSSFVGLVGASNGSC